MMKKVALVLCVVSMCVGLAGCPLLGIGSGNKLVVHNNAVETATSKNYEVYELTVVRVSDECSDDKPTGINQISERIKMGDSLPLKGLDDGKYWCEAKYWHKAYGVQYAGSPERWYSSDGSKMGYVTLSGGGSVDWYLFNAQ